MSLGQILLSTGAINEGQLAEALQAQSVTNKPLGSILVGMGAITEKQLMQALERRFKIPFYDLSFIDLDPELAQIISHQTAKKYTIVPIKLEDNQLTVATADPLDYMALDDIRLNSRKTIKQVLATSSDIKSAILRLYERTQTSEVVESLNQEWVIEDMDKLSDELSEDLDSAPVVRIVNLILNQAINSRASDLHIEPTEDCVRVRFRIDGQLYEQLTLRKITHAALITRLKIMGNMDIAEKRLPQDGRAQTVFNGKHIELRLSSLPTVHGEKMVIRILGGRGGAGNRQELGLNSTNARLFDQIMKHTNGMVLVSGPTGSGKTTTLYTLLQELNRPEINIITIEDPVEYRLDGVNQVQINPKAGLTFANGLRSILRQDPDVIMVGEIRDNETAEIAVRASITGHLVLSTIHTNDAASTITRLVDMGVQRYLVANSLIGVVAQRLVRRVCPVCREAHEADIHELSLLGQTQPVTLYEAKGCPHCNHTGYRGRAAIHEILVMNKEMRALVDAGATTDELRLATARHGTKSLRESCIELVLAGVITLDELLRVTYNEEN